MINQLPKIRAQVELLEAFAAKYNVGDRGHIATISAVYPLTPAVAFTAHVHGPWVRATFGTTDWESDGQVYFKLVDGVRVLLEVLPIARPITSGITLPA